MALNDDAVIVATVGYIFTAPEGTVAPTPSQIASLDPVTFGSQTQNFKVTGAPTSFTILVGGVATASIALAATAAQVQAAIEAVPSVGSGNTHVTGISPADTAGITVTWIGPLQGEVLPLTAGTYVAGTTPATVITQVTPVNGWDTCGHTARSTLPEFGFDGGKTTVKGSWQKKRLREVISGDDVADHVIIHLEQWDRAALELYYGADAADTDGVFGVDGNFTPVEKALLVVIIDGAEKLGFYAPKASFTRDSAITMKVDDLSELPVVATFLNLGNRRLYDWISEDLFPLAS
jgi:hypothetical protein